MEYSTYICRHVTEKNKKHLHICYGTEGVDWFVNIYRACFCNFSVMYTSESVTEKILKRPQNWSYTQLSIVSVINPRTWMARFSTHCTSYVFCVCIYFYILTNVLPFCSRAIPTNSYHLTDVNLVYWRKFHKHTNQLVSVCYRCFTLEQMLRFIANDLIYEISKPMESYNR